MTVHFENFDDLLAQISDGKFAVSAHSVARRILDDSRLNDPLLKQVLSLHDSIGTSAEIGELQKMLWDEIDADDPGSDGWLRLAVLLTLPDQVIDDQLAEYFELWAQQEGMSEQHIIAAFEDVS